jgi:NitT/TauT family transport system substrate-binding protein
MTLCIDRRGALGIAASLLIAIGAAGVAAPAAAQDKINVGALRFASHAPTFVAIERDYFADEGLDVEVTFFQAAQPMAVAIASGDLDYAMTAITGGLISLADKGAIKVIAGALKEEPGIEGQVILASNAAFEDGLTTPAQLAGRRFGITQSGSSFHYMAAKIAEKAGLAPGAIELTPLQKVPAIIGALKTGQIDAWTIVPNIAKGLTESGGAKEIGKVADYIPGYQVTTVFTSTDNAEGKRDQTEAFLRALAKGAADYNAALVDKTEGEEGAAAMVALLQPYVYPDRSVEEAGPALRDGAMRIADGLALDMESIEDQLTWFQAEGLVSGDIMLETLVDTSYQTTTN